LQDRKIFSAGIKQETAKFQKFIFPLPQEYMLAAAAGKYRLSELFIRKNKKADFICGLECVNFLSVREHEA